MQQELVKRESVKTGSGRDGGIGDEGAFLQNREYLDLFYRESYTVVEMEAGPYLAALYEDTHVSRHPLVEATHFRHLVVDVGFIYYASDTPHTRARTLGAAVMRALAAHHAAHCSEMSATRTGWSTEHSESQHLQ